MRQHRPALTYAASVTAIVTIRTSSDGDTMSQREKAHTEKSMEID